MTFPTNLLRVNGVAAQVDFYLLLATLSTPSPKELLITDY